MYYAHILSLDNITNIIGYMGILFCSKETRVDTTHFLAEKDSSQVA